MQAVRPGTLVVQKHAYASLRGKPKLGHWVGLITEVVNNPQGTPESAMIEWIDTTAPPDYNHQHGISFVTLHNDCQRFDLFPTDEKTDL